MLAITLSSTPPPPGARPQRPVQTTFRPESLRRVSQRGPACTPSGYAGRTPTIGHMATTEEPRATGGKDKWRKAYEATPERAAELSSTMSGVENEPLYTSENVGIDYERDLGYPGAYPYTRGVYPSMYRGRLWTMRQFAGFGTAEETNARFRYLL